MSLASHDVNDDEFDDHFRVYGRYVAWSMTFYDHYGGEDAEVFVRDLASRKTKTSDYVGGRASDVPGPDLRVVALVLSRDGDVAWTTRRGREVYVALDDQFGPLYLDDGERIDVSSLRLAAGRVHWINGDRTRSARLWPSGREVNCSLPSRSKLLARTMASVAYRVAVFGRHAQSSTFGCYLSNGRRTHLGDTDGEARKVLEVRVAGRYAARGLRTIDAATSAQRLLVDSYDLRTGRRKWSSLAGHSAPGRRTTFSLPNVALAPDGGFAYVVIAHRTDGDVGRVRVRWRGVTRRWT